MLEKNSLIYKFFSSNKYLLAVLIIAPLLLYFTFGTTLHNGLNDIDEHDLTNNFDLIDESSGRIILYDGEAIVGREYERINPEKGEENLTEAQNYIFEETFFDSLLSIALVSFLIGTVISSLSWGKMAEGGSIVYPIMLKSSRRKAFIELFSIPLIFIGVITSLSSLVMAYEAMNIFANVGFLTLFAYSVLTISSTMIGGYIIGVLISLMAKNTFLPIVVSLFFVGGASAFPNRSELLYPIESFIRYHHFDYPVSDECIIGILAISLALVVSYIIFKRGDFY